MKKTIRVTLTICLVSVCSMLFFGVTGHAYIDPSVSTYMIQAIAGIVVAVSAVAAIWFRRAKRKINKRLGIDENRNKEVESDDIINDK